MEELRRGGGESTTAPQSSHLHGPPRIRHNPAQVACHDSDGSRSDSRAGGPDGPGARCGGSALRWMCTPVHNVHIVHAIVHWHAQSAQYAQATTNECTTALMRPGGPERLPCTGTPQERTEAVRRGQSISFWPFRPAFPRGTAAELLVCLGSLAATVLGTGRLATPSPAQRQGHWPALPMRLRPCSSGCKTLNQQRDAGARASAQPAGVRATDHRPFSARNRFATQAPGPACSAPTVWVTSLNHWPLSARGSSCRVVTGPAPGPHCGLKALRPGGGDPHCFNRCGGSPLSLGGRVAGPGVVIDPP